MYRYICIGIQAVSVHFPIEQHLPIFVLFSFLFHVSSLWCRSDKVFLTHEAWLCLFSFASNQRHTCVVLPQKSEAVAQGHALPTMITP